MGDAPLGRDSLAAAPDQIYFRRPEFAAGEVENVLGERAGEALLGAKQDQQRPARGSPDDVRLDRPKRQGASDRLRDRRGVGVDREDLVPRLLRARGGDAAHRVDYAPELANA